MDANYSEYLGEESLSLRATNQISKISTYACNHVSGMDAVVLLVAMDGECSFLAGDFLMNVPVVGFLIRCCDGFFVPKPTGSKESRLAFCEKLAKR